MDWSSSGIRNTFEFEAIDVFNLDKSYGFIDGVIGGTITDMYRGDYRYTATLDVNGANIPDECLIRVWHITEFPNGEVTREPLGTFMQDTTSSNYIYGRYTGSLTLYSTLLKCGKYLHSYDTTCGKGTNLVDRFKKLVTLAHGEPFVSPDIDATKKTSKNHVWEVNKSSLTEMNWVADQLGGYITVDEWGVICLVKYVEPKKRPVQFTLGSGDKSITLLGVQIDTPEKVNYVNASYKWRPEGAKNDKTVQLWAEVDKSHPWHYTKIGRWSGVETPSDAINIKENPTEAEVRAALEKAAKKTLKEKSDYSRKFSVSMLYSPIGAGLVGNFVYKDSDFDEGFNVKCLISQTEVHLDATMTMECTFEEIR